jgi:hypothetical protein
MQSTAREILTVDRNSHGLVASPRRVGPQEYWGADLGKAECGRLGGGDMFRSNSIILDSTSMATTSLTLLGHGADLRRFVQCRAPCVAHRRTIGGSAATEGGPLQRRVRRRCSCVNGSRRQMDELLAKNPQRFSRCFINSPRAHTALGLAICRDQRRDVAVFAVNPTFTSQLRAYGTPSCRCCTLLNTLEPPGGAFASLPSSKAILTPR